MIIVRYSTDNKVVDLEVGAEYSIDIFNQAKNIYGQADLIFIEDGIEYCLK